MAQIAKARVKKPEEVNEQFLCCEYVRDQLRKYAGQECEIILTNTVRNFRCICGRMQMFHDVPFYTANKLGEDGYFGTSIEYLWIDEGSVREV